MVIVTGTNRGIGKAIVEKLAVESDFNVICMTSRNLAAAQEVRQAIQTEKTIVCFELDISQQASITTFTEFIANQFGNFSVLINNAGFLSRNQGQEVLEQSIQTNFYGTMNLTEALLPLAAEDAQIINVSSRGALQEDIEPATLNPSILSGSFVKEDLFAMASEHLAKDLGETGFNNYLVSKKLLNVYTRLLAKDLAHAGSSIKVNCVCPNWVRSEMGGPNAHFSTEEGAETPVFLASNPPSVVGKFWGECKVIAW